MVTLECFCEMQVKNQFSEHGLCPSGSEQVGKDYIFKPKFFTLALEYANSINIEQECSSIVHDFD